VISGCGSEAKFTEDGQELGSELVLLMFAADLVLAVTLDGADHEDVLTGTEYARFGLNGGCGHDWFSAVADA